MSNYGILGFPSGNTGLAQVERVIYDRLLEQTDSFEDIIVPAGAIHVSIYAALRSSAAATNDGAYIFFNGDTTLTNYSSQRHGNSADATTTVGRVDAPEFACSAGTGTALEYGHIRAFIPLATQWNMGKNADLQLFQRHTGTNGQRRIMYSINWENTVPIERIQIRTDNHPTDLFVRGSRVIVTATMHQYIASAR